MSDSENSMESPCVRNCCLNENDVCLGCFRSLDEIRLWSAADRPTRAIFLQRAIERRNGIDQDNLS